MANPEYTPEELETEEWRDIPNYDGVYQISNLGRVRTMKPYRNLPAPRLITRCLHKPPAAYWMVSLYHNRVQRAWFVHQLVALAFIGPRPEGHEVNHIDLDKQNNRFRNLEYRTHRGNVQHAFANGAIKTEHWSKREPNRAVLNCTQNGIKRGEDCPAAKLTAEQVRAIRQEFIPGQPGLKTTLGRKYNVSRTLIYQIVKHKAWKWLD